MSNVIGVQAHVGTVTNPDLNIGVLKPISNKMDKPQGGLWTSTWTGPETISDWVRWCAAESWGAGDGKIHQVWLLTPDPAANVYLIDSPAALQHLLDEFPCWPIPTYAKIDWVAVSKVYDAVSLTLDAHWATRFEEPGTYSWDSESTCWFRWCFTGVERLGVMTVSESAWDEAVASET